MTPSRKKLITRSVLLLGVAVVVVAGITLYPSLRERYWIWKLESEMEEERREAAERLGEIGSVTAIPRLIDAFELALGRSGYDWGMDASTSRLFTISKPDPYDPYKQTVIVDYERPVIADGVRFDAPSTPTPETSYVGVLTSVGAIWSISKRTPEHAERLLRSYLTKEKEIVRAVAASVLFDGTDRAREYVSRERISPLIQVHVRF